MSLPQAPQSSRWHALRVLLGVEHNLTSHAEKWIASLGALLGIVVVGLSSLRLGSEATAGMLVASMGASAVLLFVVPHGALSQPWPVLGGHLLSGVVGVLCNIYLPENLWTAAFAVAAAIALMQYLRCVHPPGGATALWAVVGGPGIDALGWRFILDPVLMNALSLLVLALLFNNLFPWRRYPASLMKRHHAPLDSPAHTELTQEDFEAAMHKLDTFIDISSEEFLELVELAQTHAEEHKPHPATLELARCYSNGRLGREWSVRQILDRGPGPVRGKQQVIFKTMAGADQWQTGLCTEEEFRQWARFEVELKEGRWVRIDAR